jgi:hypothetical protein
MTISKSCGGRAHSGSFEDCPAKDVGDQDCADSVVAAIHNAEWMAGPTQGSPSAGETTSGSSGGKKPPREPRKPSGGEPPDSGDSRIHIKRAAANFNIEIARTMAALGAEPPELFCYGDAVVRPQLVALMSANGEITGNASLKAASEPIVREALANRLRFFRFAERGDKWVETTPPKEIATHIIARAGSADLPRISGLVAGPCLRPDGSILDSTGYDAASGLFYLADQALRMEPIPDRPSRDDADDALADLCFLLSEFPFVGETDRAVALSMLLTPTLRPAMNVCPLHAITAPTQGSGKSMLVDMGSLISSGQKAAVFAANEDFVEVQKAVNGAMKEAIALISLDNVNGILNSNFIAQCVERDRITIRMLGGSETFVAVNASMFAATGNGLTIGDDLLRRTILCRLDPRVERAELREFSFNALDEVLRNRARYVRAALIIGKFGMQAPPHGLPEIGSFERWDRCVRRALIALGCGDPCASMEVSRGADHVLKALGRVQTCLLETFGDACFTARDIVSAAAENESEGLLHSANPADKMVKTALRDALMQVAEARGALSSKKIGWFLTKNKDRIINGLAIEAAGDDLHQKQPKYRIKRA